MNKMITVKRIVALSIVGVTALALSVFSYLSFNKYIRTLQDMAVESNTAIIDQVNTNIGNYFSNVLSSSSLIKNILATETEIKSSRVNDQMNALVNVSSGISGIYVFNSIGENVYKYPLSSTTDPLRVNAAQWFNDALYSPGSYFFSEPHQQPFVYESGTMVISLSRPVFFKHEGKTVKGVLLMEIDFNLIQQLLKKTHMGKSGYLYMVDTEDKLIYHPNAAEVLEGSFLESINNLKNHSNTSYFELFNKKTRLITVKSTVYTEWKIVGVSFLEDILSSMKDYVAFLLLAFTFTVVIAVMISIYISTKISDPISKLVTSMKEVEAGNFNITLEIKGEKEVEEMSETFNSMTQKIRNLKDEIVVEQDAKRKSELNALQAQINPHFLYNTLDSIVWMAENDRVKEVITMVTALARLFRISISGGRNMITVREEVEHAKNYLTIQKIRYKNKFEYHFDISEEVLDLKSLKLILQPIIENAIYHGIETMQDKGDIYVRAYAKEGLLYYEVTDNGNGMSPETLRQIFEVRKKTRESSGVGFKNVNDRIKLCFGDAYGLRVTSEQEEGTTVTIVSPIIQGDQPWEE